jgi:hypothetical protein
MSAPKDPPEDDTDRSDEDRENEELNRADRFTIAEEQNIYQGLDE